MILFPNRCDKLLSTAWDFVQQVRETNKGTIVTINICTGFNCRVSFVIIVCFDCVEQPPVLNASYSYNNQSDQYQTKNNKFGYLFFAHNNHLLPLRNNTGNGSVSAHLKTEDRRLSSAVKAPLFGHILILLLNPMP